MKICHNCGAQLRDEARFCKKCGTQLLQMNEDAKKSAPVFYAGSTTNCAENISSVSDLLRNIEKACEKVRLQYEQEKTTWNEKLQAEKNAVKIAAEHSALLQEQCAMLEKQLVEEQKKYAVLSREYVALQVQLEEQTVLSPEEAAPIDPVLITNRNICPQCGESITEEMMFCGNCGFRLRG